MAKLTESAFKNAAHDKNYFFDGNMWVHATSGHRLSSEGMAHFLSTGTMQSTPVPTEPSATKGIPTKDLINMAIQAKMKAARPWKAGGSDDPDFRKPGEESRTYIE